MNNFNRIFHIKKKVDTYFVQLVMPSIKVIEKEQGAGRDLPLRRMSYNNLIDSLYKDGTITAKQAGTYIIPEYLVRDYKGKNK